jgi:hypothetical protein
MYPEKHRNRCPARRFWDGRPDAAFVEGAVSFYLNPEPML